MGAELFITWANPDESYDWLKEWAREHNIPFCDWRESVNSLQGQMPGPPLWNFHSGGHFRPWVARLVADGFARQIRHK
jgi:hypothetical protein